MSKFKPGDLVYVQHYALESTPHSMLLKQAGPFQDINRFIFVSSDTIGLVIDNVDGACGSPAHVVMFINTGITCVIDSGYHRLVAV